MQYREQSDQNQQKIDELKKELRTAQQERNARDETIKTLHIKNEEIKCERDKELPIPDVSSAAKALELSKALINTPIAIAVPITPSIAGFALQTAKPCRPCEGKGRVLSFGLHHYRGVDT